ncbi:hypothetical protein [Streptomyces sp. NBC_00096]|uniref:hypothetical protein n=1 Tax=Streptomyces sp. NBC_00096 TaxID=2975650 RepID=UPI003252D355
MQVSAIAEPLSRRVGPLRGKGPATGLGHEGCPHPRRPGRDAEPDRVLTGGSLELHRLPGDPALAADWGSATGVDFEPYTAWSDVRGAIAAAGLDEAALECTAQGDYLEYRNPDTKVSVLVVDGEDERDAWPGHGDIWSVSLG